MNRLSFVLALTLCAGAQAQVPPGQAYWVWDYDLGGWDPDQVEVLPNGNIVVTSGGQVHERTPTYPSGAAVVSDSAWPLFARSSHRLPNGNTVAACSFDNQVREIDPAGNTVRGFGTGGTGCTDTELSDPVDAIEASNGDWLIVDRSHHRILRVNSSGNIVWRLGRADCAPDTLLDQPSSVIELPNGHLLISSGFTSTVIEIEPTGIAGGNLVAWYGTGSAGSGVGQLFGPTEALVLGDGSWLIVDGLNGRVVRVRAETSTSAPELLWQSPAIDAPISVAIRPGGNIVVGDQTTRALIELSFPTLAFDPQPLITEGTCSPPLTLRVRDLHPGNPQAALSDELAWYVPDPALEVFQDADCSVPIVNQLFATGDTAHAVHVRGPAGPLSLKVGSATYGTPEIDLIVSPPGTPGPTDPDEARPLGNLAVGCACDVGGGPASLVPAVLFVLFARRRARSRGV